LKFKFLLIKITVLIFLFFYFLSMPAFAADEDKVSLKNGKVNIKKIYALHPLMQYYDSSLNLFFKPVSMKSTSEFSAEVKKREALFLNLKKSGEIKINELKKKIAEINLKIKNIQELKSAQATKISEKINEKLKSGNNKEKVNFSENKDPVYDEAMKKLQELDDEMSIYMKKKSDFEEQIKKVLWERLQIHYLNFEESRAQMAKINDEIKKYINKVASLNKVGFVINESSDTAEKTIMSGNEPVTNQKYIIYDFNLKPDYNKAFIIQKPDDFYEDDSQKDDLNIAPVINKNIESFSSIIKTPDFIKEIKLSSDEVIDLTSQVIVLLLKDYGFSKENAQSVYNAAEQTKNKSVN